MTTGFDPSAYTRKMRENWNAAAPHYRRIAADRFKPIAESFVGFVSLKAGESVLDVACGPGTATALAARAVGKAGKVVGVDLSFEMLKLAGETLGTIDLREMDAEALDFPDGTFDAVICQLGLMLFGRPGVALGEMARVAKPGGRVGCVVQGVPERMLFTSLIMKTMVRHAPELKEAGGPSIYAFGPEGALKDALAGAGLARVRARRLAGVFSFPSPEDYWESMTAGAGRTGSMLRSLPAPKQATIRADVLKRAAAFRVDRHIEIPFEVVMAAGVKKSRAA